MAIRAKLGAGEWDMLLCQACGHYWLDKDIDPRWTDEPEEGHADCPTCFSTDVVREERG